MTDAAGGGDGPPDDAIRAAIDALLERRAPDATICPSEVARALRPEDWRPLMDRVRDVAVAERDAGRLELRQGGHPAAGPPFRGPIRLARAPGAAD